MELSFKSYFFEDFSKASAWNRRAKVAISSYLSSFCVELSRKRCLVKLFLKLLHGTVMQTLPYELFLEPSHGTVAQKLPCEAIAQDKTPIGESQDTAMCFQVMVELWLEV